MEEALFILAKRYYGQSEYYPLDFDGELRYSAEDFAGFLCEYYYDALLEQLSSLKPDDPEKEMILSQLSQLILGYKALLSGHRVSPNC